MVIVKLYLNVGWINHHNELSFTIDKTNIRNQGYTIDATVKTICYLFNRLDLHRVHTRLFSFDKTPLKIFEQCSSSKESVFIQDV